MNCEKDNLKEQGTSGNTETDLNGSGIGVEEQQPRREVLNPVSGPPLSDDCVSQSSFHLLSSSLRQVDNNVQEATPTDTRPQQNNQPITQSITLQEPTPAPKVFFTDKELLAQKWSKPKKIKLLYVKKTGQTRLKLIKFGINKKRSLYQCYKAVFNKIVTRMAKEHKR